jgi:hypothetical protein
VKRKPIAAKCLLAWRILFNWRHGNSNWAMAENHGAAEVTSMSVANAADETGENLLVDNQAASGVMTSSSVKRREPAWRQRNGEN